VEARGADDGGMNRFAALLDRLAYEPGRNAKLRLIAEYLRSTPDPERGWALAALTRALSFAHAKPGIIRALIAQRVDPVLFEMSFDSVGDLSETVALKDCSRRGAVILDPFGGSGTTMIAAQKSGRLARLIEYDPAYCDVILRRFEAATGTSAILARTGQTFEDVVAMCAQSETSHDPDQGRSSTIQSGEGVQ
jgi:DNA methylase